MLEIGKSKIGSTYYQVIFTGDKYYFNSRHYGIVGIAKRLDDSNFLLIIGNRNCIGTENTEHRVIEMMKRYVNKNEKRDSIEYLTREEPLQHLEIVVNAQDMHKKSFT